MNTSKLFLDFLVQPENLKVALEVRDYVHELLEKNHRRFWQLANAEIERLLTESDLSEKWSWVEFPLNRLRTSWQKAYLVPNYQSQSASFLQYAIGQATSDNGFRPFYGVSWNNPPSGFHHPHLTKLRALVIAQGITTMEPPVWIGWNYLATSFVLPENIHRLHTEPETFIEEMIGNFWNTFLILEPEICEVNRLSGTHFGSASHLERNK